MEFISSLLETHSNDTGNKYFSISMPGLFASQLHFRLHWYSCYIIANKGHTKELLLVFVVLIQHPPSFSNATIIPSSVLYERYLLPYLNTNT